MEPGWESSGEWDQVWGLWVGGGGRMGWLWGAPGWTEDISWALVTLGPHLTAGLGWVLLLGHRGVILGLGCGHAGRVHVQTCA